MFGRAITFIVVCLSSVQAAVIGRQAGGCTCAGNVLASIVQHAYLNIDAWVWIGNRYTSSDVVRAVNKAEAGGAR